MVAPTQAEIDEAVMIAKNATYKLAYELALEQKYGGVIDCCVTKLKLLWMYEKALACQKQYVYANGTIELLTITTALDTISIRAGSTSISGTMAFVTTNVTTEMTRLATAINTYQTDYVAYFDATLGSKGKVSLTAPTYAPATLTATVVGSVSPPTLTLTGLDGGEQALNCLTDEKAKKLIAKIKSMCNTK
jgi:hypothetical protein